MEYSFITKLEHPLQNPQLNLCQYTSIIKPISKLMNTTRDYLLFLHHRESLLSVTLMSKLIKNKWKERINDRFSIPSQQGDKNICTSNKFLYFLHMLVLQIAKSKQPGTISYCIIHSFHLFCLCGQGHKECFPHAICRLYAGAIIMIKPT